MTIYYLDPESGDDTKDGLSFATRWRTFKPLQAITPAKGDEFRFRASRAPYSLGNSTWVDNQEFITIADTTAYTIVDMCESGWQVTNPNSLNVLDGVSQNRQPMIEKCQQVGIIPANFTGKLAWKTLPAVMDLSAFTHISMILTNGQQWPFAMKLSLCSDVDGNVPIVDLPIERFRSEKYPALLTNGGLPLPANVRSITLSVTEADPRTFNYITFDNIIACKAPGTANHISHGVILSRMSAEEPEWLPIRGFKAGGVVYLGPVRLYPEGLEWKKWRGPAGQTELFARQPTKLRYLKNKESSFPDTTPGMEIIVSGGWNRSDMTVRDSVTWLHGEQSRMMGGGSGSSNPDLPSAADTMQMLFSYGFGAFNTLALRLVTCIGFGFAEFTQFPVQSSNYYSVNYRFDGLVSVGTGMGGHGPWSYMDMGDVTYCRNGAFTDPTLQDGDRSTPNGLPYQVGPGTYKARKIAATNIQNWFPPTSVGGQRSYLIGKIENSYYAFNNTSTFPGLEAGFSVLKNTKIRWCNYDAYAAFNMFLESCQFLDDATGLPREPRVSMSNRWGLQVRLSSVNDASWDTRCLYNNAAYAQVKEGIGRAPDKRTMEMTVSRFNIDDTIVPVFCRERVALVVARAGIPCTVSAYVKQNWKIAGDQYIGPQYACICTVEGETKGVGRVEGMNLQRPNKWGRVVITFTSDVDALVPIYLESNRQTAWATEVGLDDSGVPPDPVIPIPPPMLTDSFKFVAFYENIMGALDSYEAGTPEAVAGMQAAIGIPFPGMTSGTILDMSMGSIIGAALIPQSGTIQVYGILAPGWTNGLGWTNCYVLVRNEAGDVIAQGDPGPGNPQPIASMPGYALYALIAGVSSEVPVNGGTYTVEIWRGEAA